MTERAQRIVAGALSFCLLGGVVTCYPINELPDDIEALRQLEAAGDGYRGTLLIATPSA